MPTLEQLLSWNFWFNLRPGHLLPIFSNFLLGFSVFLFLLGGISYIKKRNKKRKKNVNLPFWRQLYYFSLTNGILGLMFFFFNYEMIPFFSSRFWYPVWGLVIVVWLYFIIQLWRTVPQKVKEKQEKDQFEEYLPNKK